MREDQFTIEKMCRVFKVSRSSYYAWLKRPVSKTKQKNQLLKQEIKNIFKTSRQRYGSPKITYELEKKGIKVSRPRVARLMRQMGLKSIIKRRFRVCTTDSNHNNPIAENLLDRNFTVEAPSKVWVSDITYIPIRQGWLYLTIVMDLFDRRIIGWSLSKTMRTIDTVIPAVNMAFYNRPTQSKLIFHSDRGVQYTSRENIKTLKEKNKNVILSMSRKGNCWDNAVAESFFKIIKSELIHHIKFHSASQARLAVFEFIEIWYNRKRSHQKLGYLSPLEFEQKYFLNAA